MIVWHFHIAFSVQYHYDFIVFIKLENWNNDLFSLFFFKIFITNKFEQLNVPICSGKLTKLTVGSFDNKFCIYFFLNYLFD